MSTRFDYIQYDDVAADKQTACKTACLAVEAAIAAIGSNRETAIALTQLEHVYARCGRAIRDDQIARANGAVALQERRGNE